jgi:hypothetical protein
MTGWLRGTLLLTFVLLAASAALIVPGSLGVGAGGGLLLILAGTAVGTWVARAPLGEVRPVAGIPLGVYLRRLWLGPVVAAVVAVVGFGASPGEVQALGGLLGLVAMANYFFRPVYYAVYATGRWASRAL